MAYGPKYLSTWESYDGVSGIVSIQEKDYAGAVIPITLKHNAVNVTPVFEGWESPVVGRRCRLNIVNDKDDYFELFELLTVTEGQFKVSVLSNDPSTLFIGFIDTKANTHKYLQKGIMQLVSSSYLSKLEFIYPTSIDTKQNITFINLIDEILRDLGVDYNIRVNCKLYAVGDTLSSGQTLFNKNGIDTETFWKNDVDRDTSLEILNKILVPLNCFIYWYENYWYIDHYTDMWNTSIDYVEYVAGQGYSPTDTGSIANVTKAILDVHDLVFKDTSQTVKVSPGYRLLQLRFDSSSALLLNLLAALNKADSPSTTLITDALDVQDPDIREWLYIQEIAFPRAWSYSGTSFYTIANSVRRDHDYDSFSISQLLATSFLTTVSEETSITLSFKYGEIEGEIYDLIKDDPGALNNYYFKFRVIISFYEGATQKYIIHVPGTVGVTPWQVVDTLGFPNFGLLPATLVEATQFDKDNYSVKVDLNVPLSEVSSGPSSTDSYLIDNNIQKYTITIMSENLYKRFKSHDGQRYIARKAVFGDFGIAVSNDVDFNLIEGSINTDFLNKKEIQIAIADNANLNYTNGILRGDDLDIRTVTWKRGVETSMPLLNWLMAEKFRIYNSTKQQITSRVTQSDDLRPFSLFTESKQGGKKFVLPNNSYYPSISEGKVQLEEYDNETEINIIEG